MRPISQEMYGIPRERVIGSASALDYTSDGSGGTITHKPEADYLDDGPQKPVRIWSRTGRRPLLAAGNSNGDIPMLEFTQHADKPYLRLLVLHDDAEREFDYTTGAEQALEQADDGRLDRRQHQERLGHRKAAIWSAPFMPAGQCFIEENEACRDRDGVRDERREAGGGQSAAVLERRLEHARAGCVADNQRDQREQPDAAEGDELGGNVSVGEQQPRGKSKRCRPREAECAQRSGRPRRRPRLRARSRRRSRAACARTAPSRPATPTARRARPTPARQRAARGVTACRGGRARRAGRERRCLRR